MGDTHDPRAGCPWHGRAWCHSSSASKAQLTQQGTLWRCESIYESILTPNPCRMCLISPSERVIPDGKGEIRGKGETQALFSILAKVKP